MTDLAIAHAPDTKAELDELVNRIGAVRERLPNAVDRIERDAIEKELGKLLFELITKTGDQFVGWLPRLYEQKINVEMLYWKIGLGPEQQAHVAAALDRFHGSTSTVSPPIAKAELPAATSERASTEAKAAAVKMMEPRATEPARKRLVISLGSIRADTEAQPRTSIFADKVSEYVEDMSRGDKFPPLVVFYDGKAYWLADGFHRYHAAVGVLGQSGQFECEVREGTLRDAVLFSCSANAAHGIRRTNEDKRRAVTTLLKDVEWGKWSNREIARQCLVSHPFVDKLRADLMPLLTGNVSSERTYKTKHGTVARMNAAAIGKLPNTVAASDAAAGPAEPVLAPAPVVLNEVETPAGDLMARTGDGQYDDVQNADAIAGTDILREALGHAEVEHRIDFDLNPDPAARFDIDAALSAHAAKNSADSIVIREWTNSERIKTARAVAAAWHRLATHLEHSMPPLEGTVRDRCALALPEKRVRRIEDELENLRSVERTPSDKDVSRSWMKRVRIRLEDELIEGGVVPMNERWRKIKETGSSRTAHCRRINGHADGEQGDE
jgi:hypothetical protein